MKKRLFGLALILCMVLALLPEMHAGAASAQLPWEAEPDKWTALTATSISLYGGNYYLTDDVTILSGMQISGSVTIDLNGHVLKYAGDSAVRVITVNSGKLTLNDSAPNATHTDTTLPAGGVVTNASTHANGGGGIRTYSTFEMNGGTIYNCSIWELGAGVSVYPNGNFTMNGGAIVDCEIDKGSNDGGGVYVYYDASFTMNDGTIRGCKTSRGDYGGGGVCVAGTFTMNDGIIEDCSAIRGGGVGLQNRCTFIMNDGIIEDCSAIRGGGVGLQNRCTFIMNGGTIQNCSVEGFGGGVLAGANSIFTMNGGSIENCSATATSGAGGGVHVNGTFNANGGTIRGCTASVGAGVWLGGKMTNTATTVNATIIYSKLEYSANGGSFDGKFVEFMDGENWYAAEIVKDDSTLIKPDAPVRAGWTFVGWYTESTLNTLWDFEKDTVRVDSKKYNFLQLYAKWACAGHVNEDPKDHKCDVCDQTLECIDENKDHKCDYECNETIGTCEDKDLDHYCDYGSGTVGGCTQYFGTHGDTNKDHVCDYGCNEVIGTCEDTDHDHKCDYGHGTDGGCAQYFGTHADTKKDHKCDYGCNETIGTCEDKDRDHYCDYGSGTAGGCTQYFGTHADTEKDHVCDYGCSVSIGACKDADTDHFCDYGCGKRFGGVCSGGSPATCKQQSVCDYCKKPYGDLDKTNHTGAIKWTIKTATGHEQKWDCCGDVVISLTAHTWAGGACLLCGYACHHPTTVTVGYKPDNHIKQWAGESGVTSCTVCGEVLRENTKIAPSAHRGGNEYASSDTEHWKTCTYYGCDAEVKNTREAHVFDDNGVCTTCGYKKTGYLRGDFDDNKVVDSDDAIYLLRHVFFGEQYPANQPADLNKDGKVTSDDAIYLLRHVFFPETYPLV